MPISDEVIELAPVKKTKKTLIIMIAGMGVLFALAVAFLVMYLVKPSVTEDKNHVKDVAVNSTGLFSGVNASGEPTLYASIGNEYTVYSTVTVDNNSSANVQWDFDPDLLEIKEQKVDGEAYIKFIPRVGTHGKTAKITARSPLQVSVAQTVTFTIVNQGAEDIQVTNIGTQVIRDDSLNKELSVDVPYYTVKDSPNNKKFQVKFKQLGAYSNTTKEYAPITSSKIKGADGDVFTDDVEVTSGDESIISISNVEKDSFSFIAKKSSNNNVVEIKIQANVNNADYETITKVIKVKVESNNTLGYVDSIYFFNKPVVDEAFIDKVLTGGNTTLIDSQKLKTEIGKDETKTLKVCSKDRTNNDTDFELVLPYSNSNSLTYNDIFKHVLVNPVNIQYDGQKIKEDWYKIIEVSSNDSNLVVTQSGDGYKLFPKGLSGASGGSLKCKLKIRDKQAGSVNAEIEVPVRIVAQNEDIELAVGSSKTVLKDNITNIDVKAATGGKYEVDVTYTFTTPDVKSDALVEDHCLNNEYKLVFNEGQMDVVLKGATAKLKPNTTYHLDGIKPEKVTGTSGSLTQYKATITFVVTVKLNDTGAAVFKFTKQGSYLYGTDASNSLKSKDKTIERSASFQITESSGWAKVVDKKTGLNIVTEDGERAGDFERISDTKAILYVQNRASGDPLSIVAPTNLPRFVDSEKPYFTISAVRDIIVTAPVGFNYDRNEKTLSFSGTQNISRDTAAATIEFKVYNVGNTVIGTLNLEIHIIDAVVNIIPATTKQSQNLYYDATTSGSITLDSTDVKVEHSFNRDLAEFSYSNVNLYYGNGAMFKKSDRKVGNNTIYTFKHNDTPLYEFDVNNRKLSTRTDIDIYKYSYNNKINFGSVQLEFLLNDSDEYVGKHYNQQFVYANRMKIDFVRKADGVALFTADDYSEESEITAGANGFNVSTNQDTEATLYASSVVNIKVGESANTTPVYVEKVGTVAPVDKAYFSVSPDLTIMPGGSSQVSGQNRYYHVTYKTPVISGTTHTCSGDTNVSYSNSKTKLTYTVTNAVRTVKSVSIFSDSARKTSIQGKQLLFGGFNGQDKYSNRVYVTVEYNTYQPSHTSYEEVQLILPSYLELANGKVTVGEDGSKTYSFKPEGAADSVSKLEFDCMIKLVKNEDITNVKDIIFVPSKHKEETNQVKCIANVQAGLKTLAVISGDNTDPAVTVAAGNTGRLDYTFNLSNRSDNQSLPLTFKYGAIGEDGYDIPYDYTGDELLFAYYAAIVDDQPVTTIDGLLFENNVKSDPSLFKIKINTANAINLIGKKLTLKFTDTYNGVSSNNVFTLEVYITVTMDIYELAFADDTDATVTVTGAASGKQTKTINIVFNDGNTTAQPTDDTIKDNKVLDVCTYDGREYQSATGITVAKGADGKTYTLSVNNNIDWSNTYYLMLTYDNVTFNETKHLRTITINTQTCHLALATDNDIVPKDGAASIVIKSASDSFKLIANVLNDGSQAIVSGKTVEYGLYTSATGTTAASGLTINNGIITVTTLAAITDTVYYRAKYTETTTSMPYTLTVAITYYVAPSAVALNISSDMYNATTRTITLYTDGTKYTSINLQSVIKATNAFGLEYGDSHNVAYAVTGNSNVIIDALTIRPNTSSSASVPIEITATYADETVRSAQYTVNIVPIADVSFSNASGDIDMTVSGDFAAATPTINTYAGLKPSYTFAADIDKLFTVSDSDSGNEKTIVLANGTTAQKGKAYTFTATLIYRFNGSAPFAMQGEFSSTVKYTVNVVGDYTPQFKLSDGNDIPTYNSTSGNTKHTILASATYGIVVTDTLGVPVTYRAETTNSVINIGEFNADNQATVTLNSNASGSFAVTVYAKIGGTEFSNMQTYYFVYGDNIASALYLSNDNGANYSEFTSASKSIDYTTTQYKFKYEITGLPTEAVVNLTVNGEAIAEDTTGGTAGTRYVVITATKPTVLRIGGTVKIGSRTIYLADKKVELTATAPNFAFNAVEDSIKPSETATFSINKAEKFCGDYEVKYKIQSGGSYATIGETSGVLTANTNVVTDQTVIVRATITVSNGVYAGSYTLDKSITITGVALPTIAWNSSAKREVSIESYTYSESDYTLNLIVGTHTYSGVTRSISASSTTLTTGTDYTFSSSTNILEIKDTAKTRAGGSILLTVTATIGSGPHAGEKVSDQITVRVLPTINSATAGSLPNALGTIDLNGSAYKGWFAPNYTTGTGFVHSDDGYSIIALSITNGNDGNYDVDGAKLVIKDNVTEAAELTIEATVYISSGAYAGTTVKGTKTVSISVPALTQKSFAWSSNNYNTFAPSKSDVLGSLESGANVTSIQVTTSDANDAQYVNVTGNGTSSPTIAIDKNCNVYFNSSDAHGSRSIPVSYTVTLDNGKVYYGTTNYSVASVLVTVSATMDSEGVSGNVTVKSEDTVIINLSADNGFTVSVTDVAATGAYLTATGGGNGVRLTASRVSSDQQSEVTITLNVAEKPTTFSFTATIQAPQTGAQYEASNTENTFAKNEKSGMTADSYAVASVWSKKSYNAYSYASSITVTAPGSDNLSKYFKSLQINDRTAVESLNMNSVNLSLPTNGNRRFDLNNGFTLNATYNTATAFELSTITVTLDTYYAESGWNSYKNTVTVQYRVRVVDTVAVTLDYNAAGDMANVTTISYSAPKYKGSYGLTNPSRVGYTFNGWYTAADGGSQTENTAIVNTTLPHTLYAHWTARTYTLKYNANDGTEITEREEKITYGKTYGELSTPSARTGYNFVCWKDSAGNIITADTVVKPNPDNVSEITLIAQWTEKYVTVTLDPNGGKINGSTDSMTVRVQEGSTFSLHTAITPTRDEHTFIEWSTAGSFTVSAENTTLTAIWKKLCTVKFNLNNSESSDTYADKQYVDGEEYGTLPTPADTASKNFSGWKIGNTGSLIGSTDTVTSENTTITLYAQWTQLTSYTVTFNSCVDGMTVNPVNKTVYKTRTYGDLPTLTRADYQFEGWYTAQTGGNKVESGDTVNLTADIPLYAQWTQVVFTVTLDAGEGKVTGNNSTYVTKVNKDQSYDLHTMIVPTRSGYVFDGWWIDGETDVKQESAITVTADITLTAHWKAVYTVTFNYNTGDDATTVTETYIEGEKYNSKSAFTATPTNDDETMSFKGWATSANATEDDCIDGNTVAASGTLYAVWATIESPVEP